MVRDAGSFFAGAAALLALAWGAQAQVRQARIVAPIDETQLQRIPHSTHPLARTEFDNGAAPASLPYDRMLLVLKPDPAKQSELSALTAAQLDPKSTQYHKWLTPQEFGQRFGAADADIAKITGWLAGHGFKVTRIANAKNVIEFSGTAGQVSQAFHTEIHQYVVNGKQHWANASDPQIPAALTPVVAGVATLHNFRKASQISSIRPQAVRRQAGVKPNATLSDGSHALAPIDFETIYNIPFISSVDGTGTTIAVVARSNIHISDIQSFQSSFGVPNKLPQIVVNGTDPGDKQDGDEAEAVLDTSWSAALAPNATVKLVVSASTNSSDGVDLSEQYIVDNNLADVMTESYGDCEANYSPAEAQFYLSLAQQAATQGITYTVAAGDSGAEGCDDPSSETVATGPVSVNILASTPYDIAVGGTEFNENGNNAYWNSSNGTNFGSATGYIPEVAWNESCTAAQCGSSNAGIWAGSGGASILFPKPSWQTNVLGIPNDGARDVPDISFTSAGHDFYLLCLDGSCTSQHGQSYFSGVSGTSAATPSFAGIMALLVQYSGGRQGQAAAKLYDYASYENFPSCIAVTPAAGCVFNDIVLGNNAVPGEVNYGTIAAQYQAGVGYDLATGLGSINVANLMDVWAGTAHTQPGFAIGIDVPSVQNSSVIGTLDFRGWALSTSGTITSVTTAIDSVPYSPAAFNMGAPSYVCSLYPVANCNNSGWVVLVDTTLLSSGPHQFDVTATASTGETYTQSSTFVVGNWAGSNPMKVNIDIPGPNSQAFSGVASFAGWAISSIAAINQVSVAVDGVSYGAGVYGGNRPDVCNVFPGEAGCPNVGWNFSLDTTKLSDGTHTVSVTAESAGGQYTTTATSFVVANTPSNTIIVAIDSPAANGGSLSGGVGLGGWTLGSTVPISNVAVSIDGIPYGNANYGGNRADACQSHVGAPGCPNVGWNYFLDTTQLVTGSHLLAITASTAAGQSTAATRMFSVLNAPDVFPISLSPFPGPSASVVIGAVNFQCLTHDANQSIVSDVLTIDGGSPPIRALGWVDTTQLANGSHTMTCVATAADGRKGSITSPFTVANWSGTNPMMLSIDTPNGKDTLSGVTGIGGWVIDQLAGIQTVAIAIDGVSFGYANYGGVRTDVCATHPNAIGCPNVGWNFLLDTTLLSDGTHTLSVTGTTTAGQSSTFFQIFNVANHSSNGIQMSIDTPSPNQALTGTAHVGGWAVDPSGAQIVSATVLVDGVVNGVAIYGGTRTDVCAVIPSGGGCPNVGWNYQLDTTPFANGPHMIEVRALSASGEKYTASQTFVVANQP